MLKLNEVQQVEAYNAAIAACGKAHKWQVSLDLLHKLRQTHLKATIVSFKAAISACDWVSLWNCFQHAKWEIARKRGYISYFNQCVWKRYTVAKYHPFVRGNWKKQCRCCRGIQRRNLCLPAKQATGTCTRPVFQDEWDESKWCHQS